VLAVIALTSFMAAYSAFMFAFLVAQDERMWTITVWIYQLQSRAPKGVLMAALTLAAIPTLLVFLAAQRVILRGIILPGEK
jgi:multiple sugar transport system permease protein